MKAIVLSLLLGASLMVMPGTEDGPDLTGIKCVINPKAQAKADKFAEYMGGKVYFCCGNCKAKFEAKPEEYSVKANHQLAATGQYVQKACPFSGHDIDEDIVAKVGGVEVGLCCKDCLAKLEGAESTEAKAEMVFNTKAFKTGFAKKEDINLENVKCMMMPKKGVKADVAVDYRDAKVFFCCKGCASKFSKKPEEYAVKANQQLVATGQYVQKACPFSGGPVSDDQVVEVGAAKVKFCCGNCMKKFQGADSDEARAQMVFSNDAFDKAFEKKN